MKYHIAFLTLGGALLLVRPGLGADWITQPSYFTHDPQTRERVTQYTPIGPFYSFARNDFQRSGYRHTRSSLQVGHSMDHMHIVEEWGRAVRPYGEWRFPYRPYSVPYPAWGPPFAGLGSPWGFPWGVPPQGDAQGNLPDPYSRQQPPPYYDGTYQFYRSRPPLQERSWSDHRGHPGKQGPPYGNGHGGGPGGGPGGGSGGHGGGHAPPSGGSA